MASLEHDAASGRYRVRFRYGGRPYKRSLKTTDAAEARAVVGRVEETIRLIERGRLVMPPDADPGSFILSDGQLNGKPAIPKATTLTELFEMYRTELPTDAKEPSTLEGEDTHIKHLLRHLKPSSVAQALTTSDLQGYADKRLRDKWHGKAIRPDTVKKEVTTFRLVWNWAVDQGYLVGPAPTSGLRYPKIDQKPPFMTLEQIQRIIDRGGLTTEQESELWDSLFLTVRQVQEVLDHVLKHARHDFVFPMFVFAAHTGARRSEIIRSLIDDFDFDAKMAMVREKKKSRKKSLTYRKVPMTDLLFDTMVDWLSKHPGGQHTICQDLHTTRGKRREAHTCLTRYEAHDHFKRTLKGSKWEKIKGFHVFRHTFASNLAAAGVDQRLIDEWMGHQTEEMRRRYRHLFPDQQQKAIASVFGANGK